MERIKHMHINKHHIFDQQFDTTKKEHGKDENTDALKAPKYEYLATNLVTYQRFDQKFDQRFDQRFDM
jgi:hypothetical protein